MRSEDTTLPPHSGDLDSPEIQFLTALWETWQALITAGEEHLRATHGLNLRTFLTLSYLQAGPQHPAELARELGIPRYEVSRALATLDGLGAITRARGGGDGRSVLVHITPAGHQHWTAALQTVRAVTGPPLSGLDPQRQHDLITGLRAVAHAAQHRPWPAARAITSSQENTHD